MARKLHRITTSITLSKRAKEILDRASENEGLPMSHIIEARLLDYYCTREPEKEK